MKTLSRETWPSESNHFCLAIQVVNSQARQFHAAILYASEGQLMIGDLQSHMRVRRSCAKADDRIFWVAPDLSLEDQKILASKIDAWLRLNPNGIPYSVAHPGGVIFKNDIWVGSEPAQGLTCATFIVELFNELAIPFIEKETWQARPGDEEWARNILGLINNIPDINKYEQMKRIGKTPRIRPADTFAAGVLIHQEIEGALTFDAVSPCAEKIENNLLLS